jgi:hypothetical protein
MAQSAEEVARESIDSYNARDFDRLRTLLADDFYEEELATQRRLEGADARVEAAERWKQAFPDEHGTITGEYASGDTVLRSDDAPPADRSDGPGRNSPRQQTPSVSPTATKGGPGADEDLGSGEGGIRTLERAISPLLA